MNLSRILFKPKWQDRDAATRLASVTSDPSPELLAALPELTRSDPDARVRIAALKRLGDYERWRERSTGDADGEVRRLARDTYIALLCSGSAGSPALPRLISELETLTPAELETVATTARNRDLRSAALERITRPALLAERATADPDAALRRMALDRIDDPAALERIAEQARKSDKAISRHARQRIESLRIESGDPGAIAVRARSLCERIEALLRAPAVDCDAQRADVEREWNSIGERVPADIAARFRGALSVLDRWSTRQLPGRAEPASNDALDAAAPPEPVAPEPAAQPDTMAADAVEPESPASAAPERPAPIAAAAQTRTRDRDQRHAALQAIEELLPRYADVLEAGDTAAAQPLDAQLLDLVKSARTLPPALEHRLAPLHARFAELRRWQHWSNQRRRRALCSEIEHLPPDLHPDALSTRVREAREEWQRLDAMEGVEASAEPSGLARRFHGVCQRALKPALAYFEKRNELRDTHRGELDTLLARVAASSGDADVRALTSMRRELAVALRALDGVSPRDRSLFARRIKDAIAALSPRIEAHAREVEGAKARLIERAAALSQRPDREAPRAARELQQQWTALGEGERRTDQRQWREFRAACDRVFAALDAERHEREAHVAAHASKARELVTEARALAANASAGDAGLAARRRDLEARWRELSTPDRALDREFRQALDAVASRITEQARIDRLSRFVAALDRYELLYAAERGTKPVGDLAASWSEGPALAGEFAQPLQARYEQLAAVRIDADAALIARARDVLVAIEFLAGATSPAEDRERRMNHQVARLSARLRGGASRTPESELAELLGVWFSLPAALPAELEARFAQAARAAIATLP